VPRTHAYSCCNTWWKHIGQLLSVVLRLWNDLLFNAYFTGHWVSVVGLVTSSFLPQRKQLPSALIRYRAGGVLESFRNCKKGISVPLPGIQPAAWSSYWMNCPALVKSPFCHAQWSDGFKVVSAGQCFCGGINNVQPVQGGVNFVQVLLHSAVLKACCL